MIIHFHLYPIIKHITISSMKKFQIVTWHINSTGSLFIFRRYSSSLNVDSIFTVRDPRSIPSISKRTPAKTDSEKQEPMQERQRSCSIVN